MPVAPVRLVRRALVAAVLAPALLAAAACGPRGVVVSNGADPAPTGQMVEVVNNLRQAVNVYARLGTGSEVFLRQVPARTTERVAVRGARDGATIALRLAPVDGSPNVVRDNVVLGPSATVRVP